MAQRIKGQEVRLTMTSPTGTVDSIGQGGVKSFDIEFKTKILDEGYLGETTNRKDDIFEGVSGRLEAHLDRQAYFQLVQQVIDRAQRRLPADARFNMIATLQFPNGNRPRILIEDVFFGPMPLNAGSRDEFVTVNLEFEAAGGRILF